MAAKRNAEVFRLVGGHQVLDLVNTVAPRHAAHAGERADALTDTTDLVIWARRTGVHLDGYLFWGAEYWLLRQREGDPSYLKAFTRILDWS